MTAQKHHTSLGLRSSCLLRYLCAKPGGDRADDFHALEQAPQERGILTARVPSRGSHSIVPASSHSKA